MEYNRDLNRFLAKVDQSSGNCWEWLASKKGGGYGAFFFKGKLHGAHRVSLFLFKGLDIETSLHAMHSCDNPSCVNPDHLSYGTRSENMKDASLKGRIVLVQDWRGELNPKAKLSTGDSKQIVELIKYGFSRKETANMFGVTHGRVCQILKANGVVSDISGIQAAIIARKAMTHCKRGHLLSGENLRINNQGGRVCRQCTKEMDKKRKSFQ